MPACSASTAKPCIAFDLDEVLGAFIEALCLYHNKHHGTALSPKDIFSYHFAHVPGFGTDEETHVKVAAFFTSPEFEALAPLGGARAALSRHRDAFSFHVVTSRSDTLADRTRAWLDLHYPGVFDGVHFTNAYGGIAAKRTKGEVCASLSAFVLVDDNVDYAAEAATRLPFVVLHGEYAWNVAAHKPLPPNVVRATNWSHLDAILTRLAAALARVQAGQQADGTGAGQGVVVATSDPTATGRAMMEEAVRVMMAGTVDVAGMDEEDVVEAVEGALTVLTSVQLTGASEAAVAAVQGMTGVAVAAAVAAAASAGEAGAGATAAAGAVVTASRGPGFLESRFLFPGSPVGRMAAGTASVALSAELQAAKEGAAADLAQAPAGAGAGTAAAGSVPA